MSEVLFETHGRAGVITLNRPKALNALSRAMCLEMTGALDEWARDDRVERVAIRGEGKAFCAGGDIRAIYDERDGAAEFFRAEYELDHAVASFPKPYVALIDGIVMGGGVGVSVHGSHRLAGENTVFAMPEVGIGLFPDVGARAVLSQLEDEVGVYLGLTGARLRRDAVAALAIATHGVASERLGDALDRVAHARALDGALTEMAVTPEPFDEETRRLAADAFTGDSVAAILERCEAQAATSEAAAWAASAMAQKSPTSLCVTLEALRRAEGESVREVLVGDYRIVRRILEGHDLFEGIRAVVIDKDNAPRWSPARLADVDREAVEAHFAPLEDDLELPAEEAA